MNDVWILRVILGGYVHLYVGEETKFSFLAINILHASYKLSKLFLAPKIFFCI